MKSPFKAAAAKSKASAAVPALTRQGVNAFFMDIVAGRHEKVAEKIKTYPALIHLQRMKDWTTALMVAAGEGQMDIARDLIKAGAPLDARDTDENTALMRAAAHGQADAVWLLINAGANTSCQPLYSQSDMRDPTAPLLPAKTLADHARTRGHDALADDLKIFLEQGFRPDARAVNVFHQGLSEPVPAMKPLRLRRSPQI